MVGIQLPRLSQEGRGESPFSQGKNEVRTRVLVLDESLIFVKDVISSISRLRRNRLVIQDHKSREPDLWVPKNTLGN